MSFPLPLLVSSTTFVNSRVYNFNCGCAHFRFRFIVVFATTSNAVVVVVAVFLAPNVACCYCCCWLSPRIKKRGLRIVRRSFSSTLAAAAAVRLQFYFTFLRLSKKKKKTQTDGKEIYVCIYDHSLQFHLREIAPLPPLRRPPFRRLTSPRCYDITELCRCALLLRLWKVKQISFVVRFENFATWKVLFPNTDRNITKIGHELAWFS